MQIIAFLIALIQGSMTPIQAGATSGLRASTGATIFATGFVYVSGLCAVLIVQLFVREGWPTYAKFAHTPWWAWTGGVLSIVSTMAAAQFAQKLGSGVFTGLSVTAALTASILLDNFGLVGFETHPVSGLRILGGGLMITGLWLVAKF